MSDEKSSQTIRDFNLLGLLGLIFITLKLCKIIGWSWWWVLAPFWIPGSLLLLAFIVGLVWSVISSFKK